MPAPDGLWFVATVMLVYLLGWVMGALMGVPRPCWFVGHAFPREWTAVGPRYLLAVNDVWFVMYSKTCPRCGKVKHHDGPLRYSMRAGGGVMDMPR